MAGNPFAIEAGNTAPQSGPAGSFPVGAYALLCFGAVALSDSQFAPLVAGVLGAAIVFNGIRVLGKAPAQVTSTPIGAKQAPGTILA